MPEPTINPDHEDLDAAAPSVEPVRGLGAQLRAGREAAGLTIDQAAQQLKLAPRQVRALEQEAFDELPGKTFTRGFMRNYARLLDLDPVALLLQLPDAAHAPALESPPLHAAGTLMAELPSNDPRKPVWTRWGIPLALVAAIAGVLGYEWYRSNDQARIEKPVATSKRAAPSPTVQPIAPSAVAPSDTSASVTTGTAVSAAPIEASANSASSTHSPLPRTSSGSPLLSKGEDALAPSSAALSAASAQKLTTPVATTDGRSVGFSLSQESWVEIKDASGAMLLAQILPAGTQRLVTGKPPFELVVGNIYAVQVNYRGQTIDLTPHARQNVARLTLR